MMVIINVPISCYVGMSEFAQHVVTWCMEAYGQNNK